MVKGRGKTKVKGSFTETSCTPSCVTLHCIFVTLKDEGNVRNQIRSYSFMVFISSDTSALIQVGPGPAVCLFTMIRWTNLPFSHIAGNKCTHMWLQVIWYLYVYTVIVVVYIFYKLSHLKRSWFLQWRVEKSWIVISTQRKILRLNWLQFYRRVWLFFSIITCDNNILINFLITLW